MESGPFSSSSSVASEPTSFTETLRQNLMTQTLPNLPAVAILRGEQHQWRVLTHLVGKGGEGKVFPAFRSDVKLEAAVKVVAVSRGSESQSFTKEVNLLKRLSHENVVRLYDV
eukprot:RCo044949